MPITRRSAFTLLELIVVVLIVSLVGFLVFSEAVKQQKKVELLDAKRLPSILRKTFQGQGDVELFCIKKCEECYIVQNGKISPYDGGIQFGKDVELYKLDSNDNFVQIDELGRVKDKKICLRYHLYDNGSTTKMVISNNLGIYYLPSFFGKATKVESMEEAKELWINSDYDLHDSGSFF